MLVISLSHAVISRPCHWSHYNEIPTELSSTISSRWNQRHSSADSNLITGIELKTIYDSIWRNSWLVLTEKIVNFISDFSFLLCCAYRMMIVCCGGFQDHFLFQKPTGAMLLASGMARDWPDGRGIWWEQHTQYYTLRYHAHNIMHLDIIHTISCT